MNSDDRKQLDLLTSRPRPHVAPVTPELIKSIRAYSTLLGAWNYAQAFSTLQDKEIYEHLGIDSSWWTKIGKGTGSPPADERFVRYMDLVQNEFPLIWLAEKRGYDWTTIRRHQSDLEKENERLRQEIAERDRADARRIAMTIEAQKALGGGR